MDHQFVCHTGESGRKQVDESITVPQFRALVILSTRGPSNLATLAGLLDVQPSTVGRMVERLVSLIDIYETCGHP